MRSAALPIVGFGAAFLAASAAVGFFFEGIRSAGKEQKTLNEIGVAVRTQGGDWDRIREQVEGYATALSHATTFSRSEAIDALRSLTTAGVSAADSEKIVAVATDVAAGSGRSLVEVTNEIKQAEVGRALGLAQLDPRLKAIIRSHGTLQEVLDELSRTYSGQASAATDTFEGKQRVLKNRLEELSVTLGSDLLPALTTGTELLIGFAAEAERQLPSWVAWGKGVVDAFQDVLDKIHEVTAFFKPLSDTLDALAKLSNQSGKAFSSAFQFVTSGPDGRSVLDPPGAAPGPVSGPGVNYGGGNGVLPSGGGFGGDRGPNDIPSAINDAASRFAKESGLTADKLAAVITAIGQQETNLGHSGNYDARTGRDRDANKGRGIFQLDPASGESAAMLDKVSTDVRAAADKATEMIVGGLKRNHGSLVAAIEAYGPHNKGVPDPAYVTSVLKHMNDAGHGQTGIAGIDNMLTPVQVQAQTDRAAWAKRASELARTALDNNPHVGMGNARGGSGAIEPLPADAGEKVEGFVASQSRLDAVLKSSKDQLLQYAEAVKLATTADAEKDAKMELAIQTQNRARTAIRELTEQDAKENAERAKLNALLPDEIAKRDTLRNSYNAYVASLGEAGATTKEEHQELARLRKEHEEAVKAVDHTKASVQTLTNYLDRNRHAIDENRAHLQDLNIILAANARAEETAAAAAKKRQLDASIRDVVKDFAQTGPGGKGETTLDAAAQKLASDKALYGQSLDAQRAYLQRRYDDYVASNSATDVEAVRMHAELDRLDLDSYKKRADEAKAASLKIIGLETTFLDDIIGKHKGLRASLKDVWSSIVADFEASLIKMIESKYLNAFFAKLMGGFGGGVSGGGMTGGGIFGALAGGVGALGGASSGAAGLGGLGSIVSLSGDAKSALTGSPSGIAPSSLAAFSNSSASSPLAGISVPGGTLDAKGNIISGGSSLMKTALGGAAEGAMISSVISGIFGGNATNAGLLGGLGGAVGSIFGGPLGGTIGSVAGSLLGGLFGPHVNAYNNPDIQDTQNYAQGLANVTGKQAGANGYTAQADQNVLSVTGGIGEIGFAEKLLAQGEDGYRKATGESHEQYLAAMRAVGASATGAGTIKFGKNIGDQTIVGATSGGNTQMRYNDLDNLLSGIMSDYTKAGGQAGGPTPAFKLDRLYPDANIATLRDAKGNVVGASGTTPGTTPGTTDPGGKPGGSGQGSGQGGNHPVNVVVNGSVVGSNGMHELAQILSQAMYDNDRGIGKSGYVAAGRHLAGDGN